MVGIRGGRRLVHGPVMDKGKYLFLKGIFNLFLAALSLLLLLGFLAVMSRGYSTEGRAGFSLQWLLKLWERAIGHVSSGCGPWA